MSLFKFLEKCSDDYYKGKPTITDEQFDYLSAMCGFSSVGHKPKGITAQHRTRLYSLQKYYPDEGAAPLSEVSNKVNTPKIDGAAVSALYYKGQLIQVLTRGNGEEGLVVTDKFLLGERCIMPRQIDSNLYGQSFLQISGEIVAPKSKINARNYAAGALNLDCLGEFNSRELFFVAYDVSPNLTESYSKDLDELAILGFNTVKHESYCEAFPQDGRVIRVDNYELYFKLGFTAKHPRGAYALKERKQAIKTKLLDVVWQTGKSGKVTPVAILEPVVIGGATISRATLNNPGYIKALNIEIGDDVMVVRSGEIIPQIVGKAEDFEDFEAFA